MGFRMPWFLVALACLFGFLTVNVEANAPVKKAAAAQIPKGKATSKKTTLPPEALVGYAVRDVKTGRILAQREGARNFVPASTVKLITAQLVLEALGPDKVFVTRVMHSGQVRKHALEGDMVIRGDGDPALGSKEFGPAYRPAAFFAAVTDSLRKLGIAEIKGAILPDASALTHTGADPSAMHEDVGNYYFGLATGLAFMDNAYAIRFQGSPRVGEPLVLLGTEPAEIGITRFDNHLLAGPSQSRDSAYIFGTAPSPLRSLRGTYPAGHWEFRIRGSLPDPGWTLTRELLAHLVKEGLRVQEGKAPQPYHPPQAERLKAAQTQIASWPSPPLRDLLRRMLIFSDNHVAAHLFAQAARAAGHAPSREGGLQALGASMAKKKLDLSRVAIYDGMGLSPLNRLSPELFTAYLQHAANNAATFPHLLAAMAGSEGTEERIARYGQAMTGKLWAKTGTLEGVAALAGFMKTKTGKTVSFALFANHFIGKPNDVQTAFGPLLQQWHQL